MECDIAIVIPVYKGFFFRETLNSIINQTDQNFHIYIGDDASNDDIMGIIKSFDNLTNLTYKRFNENLGGTSLSAHWNRCIDMANNEPWIWLFSDDDIMDSNCIEEFRKKVLANPDIRLFKYNSVKFQGNLDIVQKNTFPNKFCTIDFLNIKLNYISESYVVEYIFHKSIYEKAGKFPDLPLGWCSDDLFWVHASLYTNIVTVPNAIVYWRYSNRNISGKINSKSSIAKLKACVIFLRFLKQFNIVNLNKNIGHWAIFWFMKQYAFLKKGAPKLYKLNLLIKIVVSFPYFFFAHVLRIRAIRKFF